MLEAYLAGLELAYYEVQEAFKGLAGEHVWKRPAEGLLSVGELAGHHAFWEAVRLAGNGADPAQCRVSSPLIDPRFRYYPITLATPPSEQHRAMTAEQVCWELLRVHEEAVAQFKIIEVCPAAHRDQRRLQNPVAARVRRGEIASPIPHERGDVRLPAATATLPLPR